jgi:hypothetical protein
MTLEARLAEAISYFRIAATGWSQESRSELAYHSLLRALALESQIKQKTLDETETEFSELRRQLSRFSLPSLMWRERVTAFVIAAAGGTPPAPGERHSDPLKCPYADLRQEFFVSKIFWLDLVGEKDEAAELRTVYRKDRERLAESVPLRYRHEFLAHPFYSRPIAST